MKISLSKYYFLNTFFKNNNKKKKTLNTLLFQISKLNPTHIPNRLGSKIIRIIKGQNKKILFLHSFLFCSSPLLNRRIKCQKKHVLSGRTCWMNIYLFIQYIPVFHKFMNQMSRTYKFCFCFNPIQGKH